MSKTPLRLSRCIFLLTFLAITFILAGCSSPVVSGQQFDPTGQSHSTSTPEALAGGHLQVWFTDPEGIRDGAEPLLGILDAIQSARTSIDLAIYSFSQPQIASVLLDAQKRGVKVRLVMESDNLGKEIPRKLLAAGIPIVGDGQDSLMHDKFMVVDGVTVLTGSVNYTQSGLMEDNNFLLRVDDSSIADAYSAEFESMFTEKHFGEEDLSPTAKTRFSLGSTPVEVYFSPEDGIAARLADLAEGSDRSIHFLAYTFTLDDLGQQLIDISRSGVNVQGVFEGGMLPGSTGSEYDSFRRAGLEIRQDGNPNLMHEKLFVIDGNTVVLGSYNFTRAADERNDENLLVIHDSQIASLFESEFQRVFQKAQP